jgi:ketosteroid isomerase-like protein
MVAGKRDANGASRSGAILRQFYDAVTARDLTGAWTFIAEDFVFVGLFEIYRGADAYLRALAGLLAITTRLEVRRVIGQGDDAAAVFDLETKAPADGKALVAQMAPVQEWKDRARTVCPSMPDRTPRCSPGSRRLTHSETVFLCHFE